MISTVLSAFCAGLMLDKVVVKMIYGERDYLSLVLFALNAAFAILGCVK